jgi:hypothetical protein
VLNVLYKQCSHVRFLLQGNVSSIALECFMFRIRVSHVSVVIRYVVFIGMLNMLKMPRCLPHEIRFY